MRFEEFAAAHGLVLKHVEAGRWVRCPTDDKPGKRNGAYFYDGDYAHVQNWATMPNAETWFLDKPMAPCDRESMQKRMEASRNAHAQERQKAQQAAAKKAEAVLHQSKIEQHAYLDGKGFPDAKGMIYRPDETTNLLVIPMRVGKRVVGCQLIDRDGGKKFLFGQRCSGAEYVINGRGVDIWCEGYATGLSISAVMAAAKARCCIHVCFSAGNMEAMAKAAGRGFVVADNDISGAGEKAAKGTGLPYFMPPDLGTDFNDYHKAYGLFSASQAMRKFLQQQ
ncbi:MAG: hypothetical protein IPP52_16910 [Ignavibacteria bacterium]|nr:hypothetical protein [Ignavibacteria bacterium]